MIIPPLGTNEKTHDKINKASAMIPAIISTENANCVKDSKRIKFLCLCMHVVSVIRLTAKPPAAPIKPTMEKNMNCNKFPQNDSLSIAIISKIRSDILINNMPAAIPIGTVSGFALF